MQNPKISTLTLTYNHRDILRLCLESLRRCTRNDFEMIVVDNGSTDGSQEMVKTEYPEAILIALRGNIGVCQRNEGITVAKGEFIGQVDDDVVVWPSWDETMLGQFTDEVAAVGPQGFIFTGWDEPHQGSQVGAGRFSDFVTGYCCMMRNIPEVRYDPDFNPRWHEETALQFNLRSHGWRLRTCRPCCSHCSLAGPVDWPLHNERVALLKEKFELTHIQFEEFDQEAYLKERSDPQPEAERN